jgi:hypothetical protein
MHVTVFFITTSSYYTENDVTSPLPGHFPSETLESPNDLAWPEERNRRH